jgi:hypothetical protein
MGFYVCRLHRHRPETVSVAVRLRQVWHGLSASFAVLPGARSRTTTLVALALGVVMSMPSAGLAEIDEPAQFAVLGLGSAPCSNFVRAVSKTAGFTDADRLAMLAWAQGYLSFYNSVEEGTYDVTHGSGPVALQQWLVEFCRKHPRGLFISAVNQLLLTGGREQPVLGAVTH